MRRFCIIFTFLCVCFGAEAQHLEAALLEREAYRSEDPAQVNGLLLRKARLLLREDDASAACEALTRVRTWLLEEEELGQYSLLREEAHYRLGEYETADSYRSQADGAASRLDVLVLAGCRRYEASRQLAAQYLAATLPAAQLPDALSRLESLYRQAPKPKKEKTAAALAFLPPLGQWYTGHPGEGFLSMLENAAAAGFTLWQLLDGNYVTGLLGGGVALEKTFMSNLNQSIDFVTPYNEEKLAAFLGQLEVLLGDPDRL